MIIFERMKKSLLAVGLLISASLSAQVGFSLATGLSGLHNFSPQQQFWAFGQTVQTNFHFTPKDGAYVSLDFYTEGKYKNSFTAIAKSSLTQPEQLSYTATGRINYREFSLGVRHYFRGTYNADKDFNLYGIAGFGLLFSKLSNTNSPSIDTALYQAQVAEGEGHLQKLTFDLGFGGEVPVATNFFIFVDGRTWLPASSSTSPYLHNQKNVPMTFMLSAGLRVLFASY